MIHHSKPDFHGSSTASLVDPASVMTFMGGLLSIATVQLQLLPLAQQKSWHVYGSHAKVHTTGGTIVSVKVQKHSQCFTLVWAQFSKKKEKKKINPCDVVKRLFFQFDLHFNYTKMKSVQLTHMNIRTIRLLGNNVEQQTLFERICFSHLYYHSITHAVLSTSTDIFMQQ